MSLECFIPHYVSGNCPNLTNAALFVVAVKQPFWLHFASVKSTTK